MKISIIIPNYNGESLLKKNLSKVIEAADFSKQKNRYSIEIIIVDDFSSDNSLLILNQNSSKIKILRNDKNLGFSSTVNRGVKEAEGEIVILLNTDVLPQKDFLLPLVEHFQNKSVAAVGCMDKSIEGKKVILRGRGIGAWKRGLLMHQRGEVDEKNTLWVSGGSSAVRKSIWDSLGGFNTIYNPFYWEDIDFSYRCVKSGYTILFEPKSIVTHEHETGVIKSEYSKEKVKIIAYRNQLIFSWVNITDFSLFLSHLLWLPYHVARAIFSRDQAFILGFFQAVGKIDKVLKSRVDNARFFVKTDKEVISQISKK